MNDRHEFLFNKYFVILSGDEMRKIREANNISISDSARYLGLDKSIISRLESGKTKGITLSRLLYSAFLNEMSTSDRRDIDLSTEPLFLELSEIIRTANNYVDLINRKRSIEKLRLTFIYDLDFSPRTYNALTRNGIQTLGELADKSESDLLNIRGLGKSCVEEIKLKLSAFPDISKEGATNGKEI